jgi:hypothetical protein
MAKLCRARVRPKRCGAVLWERIEGILLGLAIGDSLGNTTEGQLPGVRQPIRGYLPNRYAGGRRVGLPVRRYAARLLDARTPAGAWSSRAGPIAGDIRESPNLRHREHRQGGMSGVPRRPAVVRGRATFGRQWSAHADRSRRGAASQVALLRRSGRYGRSSCARSKRLSGRPRLSAGLHALSVARDGDASQTPRIGRPLLNGTTPAGQIP